MLEFLHMTANNGFSQRLSTKSQVIDVLHKSNYSSTSFCKKLVYVQFVIGEYANLEWLIGQHLYVR